MHREINLYHYLKTLNNTFSLVFVSEKFKMKYEMSMCFEKAKKLLSNIKVLMMDEFEVMFNFKKDPSKEESKEIFVLESFNSYSLMLHYLKNETVYSLPLMIATLNHKDVLVTQGKSLLSNAFKGLAIYASGISFDEIIRLEKLLQVCDGRFVENLEEATHMIVKSIKTMKYDEALELDLPIYHLDWIRFVNQVCSISTNGHLKATSEMFNQFRLKIFTGVKFFLMGFDDEEKEEIENLLIDNGGSLIESSMDNFDILIIGKNNPSYDDYLKAKEKGIKCLKPSWINDSIDAKFALQIEEHYLVNEVHFQRTPRRTRSKRRLVYNDEEEDSPKAKRILRS